MKKLILAPVGYPLRAQEEHAPYLSTDDPSLFQHYARSQWVGLIVQKESFLFDSLLFPDYAFRALTVEPDNSQITKSTKISLDSIQKTEPPNLIHRKDVKFNDIIGQNTAKEKCRIISKFLSDESLLNSPWFPRNILFWGPPGNGKTMVAKALSSEIRDSKFFLIKASELLGIYVGDGARKIKNLYAEARKVSPSIIFIDELDSIALKRNFQSIRGDVVELVGALLGEMDGIDVNQGVITIGSTNQPDILDPAILNRFEELIEFKNPDLEERIEILKRYAQSSPILFEKIPWRLISQKTGKWSGRDLKDKIIKNAIQYAVLHGHDKITMNEIGIMLQKANILLDEPFYFT